MGAAPGQHEAMFRPAHLVRRSVASAAFLVVFAPLFAPAHHHEPDHDGAVAHLEHAHGPHAPSVAEMDDRQTSAGLQVPAGAAPAPGLSLDRTPVLRALPRVATVPGHAARAPPGTLRTRAPPLVT